MAKKTRRTAGRLFPNWPQILKDENKFLPFFIISLYLTPHATNIKILRNLQRLRPRLFRRIQLSCGPVKASFLLDAHESMFCPETSLKRELDLMKLVGGMQLPYIILTNDQNSTPPNKITGKILKQLRGKKWQLGITVTHLHLRFYIIGVDFEEMDKCSLGDIINDTHLKSLRRLILLHVLFIDFDLEKNRHS